MTRRSDFVICGGGVYGCGLAWELSRRGASVVLLEARTIASGASGGPGRRGVRANSRDERELPLSRLANELWPSLGEELGADTGHRRTGGLELFEAGATRERAAAQVKRQRRHGIASQLVDRDELVTMEPGLSDRVLGAVHCPDDGVVDHTATTRAYAAAAQRQGATVLEGVRATTIEASVVVTDSGRFEAARAVVLATNAAAGELLSRARVPLSSGRVLPQIVFTEPALAGTVRHLIGHLERRLAVKQEADGALMISGGWLGAWNAATQRGEVVADQVEGNVADARAVFPAIEDVAIAGARADRAEAVGSGLLPVIDLVPGLEGVVVATGWTGHGFAIAPAVCRLVATWLLGGIKPPLFEPFSWRS